MRKLTICWQCGKKVKPGFIEGLSKAKDIAEAISLELGEYENRWSINELLDRIDAEIAALEKKS